MANDTDQIMVSVPAGLKEAAEKRCGEHNESLSAWVRGLIAKALSYTGDINIASRNRYSSDEEREQAKAASQERSKKVTECQKAISAAMFNAMMAGRDPRSAMQKLQASGKYSEEVWKAAVEKLSRGEQ